MNDNTRFIIVPCKLVNGRTPEKLVLLHSDNTTIPDGHVATLWQWKGMQSIWEVKSVAELSAFEKNEFQTRVALHRQEIMAKANEDARKMMARRMQSVVR